MNNQNEKCWWVILRKLLFSTANIVFWYTMFRLSASWYLSFWSSEVFYSSKIDYQESKQNINNLKIIMCLKKKKPGVCNIIIHIISYISKLSVEIITIYEKWEKERLHILLDISYVELYSTWNIFFQTDFEFKSVKMLIYLQPFACSSFTDSR